MKNIQADGLDLGLDSHQFTMKASAKAFAVLSSGLYSNKTRAVIRELACNAYDSQVGAGTADRPFDVKLPHYGDSTFYVRDYGTGLSEDDLKNVYTTYFESTKTESNEFVGALGLGSKSPFCLTDSFTVESFFNGMHYTYLAFIGKSGMPELSKVGEEETVAQNGLKVSFMAKDDFYRFKDEAKSLFQWFPVVPNIICDSDFEINKLEPAFVVSDTVASYNRGAFSYCDAVLIKQGTVVYPISTDSFRTHFSKYGDLTGLNLVIEVPIGDVDVTASRESLSMVSVTIENLNARFDEVTAQLTDKIHEELSTVKDNVWELSQMVHKLSELLSTRLVHDDSIVKNHPLYDDRRFRLPSDDSYITDRKDMVRVTRYKLHGSSRFAASRKDVYPFIYSAPIISSGTVIFINDSNRGALAPIRLYAQKNTVQEAIIIDFVDKKKYSKRIVNTILRKFHNPINPVYVSTLKRPERRSSGVTTNELTCMEGRRLNDRYFTAYWSKVKFEGVDHSNSYFVTMDRKTITRGDTNLGGEKVDDFKDMVRKVFPTVFDDINLYGLNKSQAIALDKAGLETNKFFDYLKERVLSLTPADIGSNTRKTKVTVPPMYNNCYIEKLVNDGKIDSDIVCEIVKYARSDDDSDKLIDPIHLKKVCEYIGMEMPEHLTNVFSDVETIVTRITENIQYVLEKAPMVQYFSPTWTGDESSYKVLADYLNEKLQ